jgi:Skp family chaperone for outer membrane proteins
MKKFFAAMLIFLMASSAFAASEKIAFIDQQAVFDKTKLGKNYQKTLKEYYESRKNLLDLDGAEIQKLQDDYQKQMQAKLLNEKARKEKEEALGRKINEYQKKREEFQGEMSKKSEELFNDFYQQMTAVVKDISKKEKIALVLSKTINVSKSEVPAVIYGEESLDLTDQVVAEMDKKTDAKQ